MRLAFGFVAGRHFERSVGPNQVRV